MRASPSVEFLKWGAAAKRGEEYHRGEGSVRASLTPPTREELPGSQAQASM
jgi:hypothetical protein